MPVRRITSPDVAEAEPGLWSNCLVVDKTIYLAGMTARGKDQKTIEGADEYEQTKTIFRKYQALMTAAGGKMSDIVKLTIFVTDISQRQKVWQARREFFTGDFPTCALVEVSSLAGPEVLVEIQGIGHLGAS
ncbi:RidA family protein [Bradyrhizobium sp. dw_78]|uniref:RidA family protein n=1 Tax=Bradyrhizobium sp. dw_78 TaxID=2719793 RepID=UPI001BD4C922|nr:RidA family protein [Bradyrhizobium sp. dw_78]